MTILQYYIMIGTINHYFRDRCNIVKFVHIVKISFTQKKVKICFILTRDIGTVHNICCVFRPPNRYFVSNDINILLLPIVPYRSKRDTYLIFRYFSLRCLILLRQDTPSVPPHPPLYSRSWY